MGSPASYRRARRACHPAPSRDRVMHRPRGARRPAAQGSFDIEGSHPMNRSTAVFCASLLTLAILAIGTVSVVHAQAKSELTVALASFSAETLDPALQGHNVKYYLSLMFDYLVGTTPDGHPSQAGGLASKWESSADHKRWTFHLRKGVK